MAEDENMTQSLIDGPSEFVLKDRLVTIVDKWRAKAGKKPASPVGKGTCESVTRGRFRHQRPVPSPR